MMAFKPRSPLLVFALFFVSLALVPQLHAERDTDATTVARLAALINPSGKDYQVKIRITSRNVEDERSVVYLVATRDSDPGGDKLLFEINGDNATPKRVCLVCLPAGNVESCSPDAAVSLPEPETRLPGSILPWEEFLAGACGSWVVEEVPADSISPHLPQGDYRVRLVNAAFAHSWANTLVTMDADSRDPVYFDRVDPEGVIMRRIRVLNIGAMGNWRGLRRAIVDLPGEGRVLMEVVDFRKGAGEFH